MERKELVAGIRKKYQALRSVLDERQRRLWAASEAQSLPHGGVSVIAQATGLSRSTVHAGMRELSKGPGKAMAAGRIRRIGGGRKSLAEPKLLRALEELVAPTTRGDPESALRWTCKSTRKLAEELQRQGFRIGDRKVADLLHQMEYSLQGNARQRQDHRRQRSSGSQRSV